MKYHYIVFSNNTIADNKIFDDVEEALKLAREWATAYPAPFTVIKLHFNVPVEIVITYDNTNFSKKIMKKIHCLYNGRAACGINVNELKKAKVPDYSALTKEEQCERCTKIMKARGYVIYHADDKQMNLYATFKTFSYITKRGEQK